MGDLQAKLAEKRAEEERLEAEEEERRKARAAQHVYESHVPSAIIWLASSIYSVYCFSSFLSSSFPASILCHSLFTCRPTKEEEAALKAEREEAIKRLKEKREQEAKAKKEQEEATRKKNAELLEQRKKEMAAQGMSFSGPPSLHRLNGTVFLFLPSAPRLPSRSFLCSISTSSRAGTTIDRVDVGSVEVVVSGTGAKGGKSADCLAGHCLIPRPKQEVNHLQRECDGGGPEAELRENGPCVLGGGTVESVQ